MSNEDCLSAEPYTIPYFCDFESAMIFNEWTVIDLNGGTTWTHTTPTTTPANNGVAQYTYSWTLPASDWLISPPIMVSQPGIYKLSFKYGTKAMYPPLLRLLYSACLRKWHLRQTRSNRVADALFG